MADQNDNHDWREKQFDYGKYRFFYRILGGAVLVSIGVLIGWWLFSEKQVDYLLSICTNGLAIAFGVFVIDQLARWREEERFKKYLIYKMGSRVNDEAVRAVEELRRHGWLEDGSLRKAALENANLNTAPLEKSKLEWANLNNAKLQQVNFHNAELYETWLIGAELQDAQMHGANLQKAHLGGAKLQKAFLSYADLKGAILEGADLTKAVIEGANMQGANLRSAQLIQCAGHRVNFKQANLSFATIEGTSLNYANLCNTNLHRTGFQGVWLDDADLENAVLIETALFDENTTLPDGTKWTPDTDIRRFTDPTHPDFWRSDNPSSPAYREKKEG